MTNTYVDETTVRVRYAETDAMGVVHHSNYIIWFEAGRSSFLRSLGRSYAYLERAGYHLRIAEVGARYLAPAFYDELLLIRTWLSETHSRSITFSYEVIRPAGSADEHPLVLTTGFTKLICTDHQGVVHRLPEGLLDLLPSAAAPTTGHADHSIPHVPPAAP